MDRVRLILSLEQSATEEELLELLKRLTVPKLKAICKEFSLKRSGNKATLIGGIASHWTSLLSDEEDKESSEKQVGSSNAFEGLKDAWAKDISALSGCNLIQIYKYLVNRRCEDSGAVFDDNTLKAYKSLKAYRYFSDGLVTNVWGQEKDAKTMVIRSHCFSSLKAKTVYVVHVLMLKNGDVLGAQCNCVAGKGGACSHVAALLFYLENFFRNGATTLPSEGAVTDRLQQWHVPPKRSIVPLPLSEMAFQKPSYGKSPPSSSKPPPKRKFQPQLASSMEEISVTQLVQDIIKINPSSGLSHFWLSDKEVVHNVGASDDREVESGLMLLARKLIVFDGEGMCLPENALDLASIDTAGEYFKELCHEYMEEQVIDKTLTEFIERSTREQSKSPLWIALRNGRITSSVFGEICSRRDSTSPISICKRLMGYTSIVGSTPSLTWGREHETVARECYVKRMQALGHKHINVQPSGLSLLPEHSFLGASADGIITNHKHHDSPGVLEIKCPFSVMKSIIVKMTPFQIAKKYPGFYLHFNECGKLHLDRSSHYYQQVQGEMAIKGCTWAHFVVYTDAPIDNLFIEEINFDQEWWQNTLQKLKQFYVHVLVPEILTRCIQKNAFNLQ